jgi:hypothetical protein
LPGPPQTEERRSRLDALGFVWDPLTERWEEGFSYLEAFKAREGHCRVPKHALEGGFTLGSWAPVQRKRQQYLSEDRRSRLDALGFVWDPHTEQWEEGFSHLEAFKAREGHCRVPGRALEGGYRLGQWIRNQRSTSDTVSEDRRSRLDALGFVWVAR